MNFTWRARKLTCGHWVFNGEIGEHHFCEVGRWYELVEAPLGSRKNPLHVDVTAAPPKPKRKRTK